MLGHLRALAAMSVLLLISTCGANLALAQKPGGVLKIGQYDSPASMSIHEEFFEHGRRPDDGGL